MGDLSNAETCGFYRAAIYFLCPDQTSVFSSFNSSFESLSTTTNSNNSLSESLLEPIDIINESPIHSTPSQSNTQNAMGMKEKLNLLKTFFGRYFHVEKLEYKTFSKNINRFINKNKDWAREQNQEKNKYYSHFSPSNWAKLSTQAKNKHNTLCTECNINIIHNPFHSLYPSKSMRFAKERGKI